jgi:hypothetical protein
MLERLLRRMWLLGVPVGLVGAAAVIAYARPWHDAPAAAREVSVERATLRPGAIVLVVVNNSEETARVEAYDVQLMTATGATIAYEIEEAEAGTQQA